MPGDFVLAFQRDAYEALRTPETRAYSLDAALSGNLEGSCNAVKDSVLLGLPPTRFLESQSSLRILRATVARLHQRASAIRPPFPAG